MYDWDDISEFFDEDFAESAEFRDKPILAIPYESEITTDTNDAGEEDAFDQKVMIQVSDCAKKPAAGELFKLDDVDYVISAPVKKDSTKKGYLLNLKEDYR